MWQTVEKFAGLHAELLLKTGREVTRIAESYPIGKVAHTDIWVLDGDALGLLHADISDEGRNILACNGAQFII